jgi:hypothetical protein
MRSLRVSCHPCALTHIQHLLAARMLVYAAHHSLLTAPTRRTMSAVYVSLWRSHLDVVGKVVDDLVVFEAQTAGARVWHVLMDPRGISVEEIPVVALRFPPPWSTP